MEKFAGRGRIPHAHPGENVSGTGQIHPGQDANLSLSLSDTEDLNMNKCLIPDQSSVLPEANCVSMKSNLSMNPPSNFKKRSVPNPSKDNRTELPKKKRKSITDLEYDDAGPAGPTVYQNFKSTLLHKFQHLNDLISNNGRPAFLNDIYTELYITEGESGKVNEEHEVRQIETASRRRAAEETPIKCSDIFKPLSEPERSIRTVLTKGVAGIGKTVSVQKFVLDWAEGTTNQDVIFMFPLPFRELNLLKKDKLSLVDLLQLFFKEIKDTDVSKLKVLFIFDGLDEYRFTLDFQNTVRVSDPAESSLVDVLLINLIKGNLLPSAHIWITSRPAAADQIPLRYIDRVTEVRGFNDSQKEEYFRKKVSDPNLTDPIINHMKSLRSLHIMCHIPVFCWMSATVLEKMLGKGGSGEIPKTLTQMFTHFLIIQTNIVRDKYKMKKDEEILVKLGKLAFKQLEKGKLIFYEEDLTACGVDVKEASVYSGVCTQIFREELGLHTGRVFSFVHLSVQEFLAAFFTLFCFTTKTKTETQTFAEIFDSSNMSDFLKSTVDLALKNRTGRLDLYLRFLLGLSLESNQKVLQDFLPQTEGSSDVTQETTDYIKEKIREEFSTEKTIYLFHCLNELMDDSLVREVQTFLNRGGSDRLSGVQVSPDQWSALVFVLLISDQELKEFDLKKYQPSEECFYRLLPVIKESRKVMLCHCNLTADSCTELSSVLSSAPSHLKELHLSNNTLRDSGVKKLAYGLRNSNCRLEILWLECCHLTKKSCEVLSSKSSSLIELNLSHNELQDSGVKLLSAKLEDPHCKLEILRLINCSITNKGFLALASALKNNSSSKLRELYLYDNKPEKSGVEQLSELEKNPDCNLKKLQLEPL